MRFILALCILCVYAFICRAQDNALCSWSASPDTNVVGYEIYYGGASGDYTNSIDSGNATTVIVTGLVPGATYYFAATAYDAEGNESIFSNEAIYTTPLSLKVFGPPLMSISALHATNILGPWTPTNFNIGLTNGPQEFFRFATNGPTIKAP